MARDVRAAELRRLVGADHPHLLPVVDVREEGGTPFVGTAPVAGRTLAECLPLSGDEAALVARSLSAALASLHAGGVVHGAVSAGNVVVAEDGTVLLGPPEAQLPLGARAEQPADDVLALGRLLEQALAGADAAAAQDLPWPGLVAALTAPEPADRPTAAELLHRLDGAGSRRVPALPARRPPRPPSPGVPASRAALRSRLSRPPVLGALLLVLPLLAAVLLVLRLAGGEDEAERSSPSPVPSAAPQPSEAPPQPTAQPVAGPVAVADVQLFAPGGSRADYPEDVPLAADGDPSTAWTSQRYGSPAFGNLRPGVGLLYDLGEPTDVAELRLQLPFPGASRRVHAGDEASDALLDGPPRAQVEDAPAETVARTGAGAPARWWVVWFDRLPASGELRAGVAETTFLRR